MQIELMPLSEPMPALYNPRKDLQPGEPEYEKLKRSIEEFGLIEPRVYNRRTGRLVGGHQRHLEQEVLAYRTRLEQIVAVRTQELVEALTQLQGLAGKSEE